MTKRFGRFSLFLNECFSSQNIFKVFHSSLNGSFRLDVDYTAYSTADCIKEAEIENFLFYRDTRPSRCVKWRPLCLVWTILYWRRSHLGFSQWMDGWIGCQPYTEHFKRVSLNKILFDTLITNQKWLSEWYYWFRYLGRRTHTFDCDCYYYLNKTMYHGYYYYYYLLFLLLLLLPITYQIDSHSFVQQTFETFFEPINSHFLMIQLKKYFFSFILFQKSLLIRKIVTARACVIMSLRSYLETL